MNIIKINLLERVSGIKNMELLLYHNIKDTLKNFTEDKIINKIDVYAVDPYGNLIHIYVSCNTDERILDYYGVEAYSIHINNYIHAIMNAYNINMRECRAIYLEIEYKDLATNPIVKLFKANYNKIEYHILINYIINICTIMSIIKLILTYTIPYIF